MDEEELPTIVIDNGSANIRAGLARDMDPKTIFPAVVGQSKGQGSNHVGNSAQSKRDILSLEYPIHGGIINNWDDMEVIWQHVYQEELRVPKEEHPVVLTETSFNPKANREKTMQVMFEKFHIPALFIANQASLSLSASGRTSGVVIDAGYDVTRIVPIYEMCSLPYATRCLDYGGNHLAQYLKNIFTEKGCNPKSIDQTAIFTEIKKELCYVAQDYANEVQAGSPSLDKKYSLPDGQVITIGIERLRCAEGLFQPSMIGKDLPGIHTVTQECINRCGAENAKNLFANVVLCGGSTLFPGIADRMQREMTALAPSSVRRVKVFAKPNRQISAWVGGSVVGALPTFKHMWIARQEYDEFGSCMVHRKCFM